MFLIKYDDTSYVDGEKIDWFDLKPGDIRFTVSGDIESMHLVGVDYEKSFINHIQALNKNKCCDFSLAEPPK